MKGDDKMGKGSLKSYLIYIALCFVTFLLLFLFVNNIKKTDLEKESVLNGVIPEIGEDNIVLNLQNYSVDNSKFVLYILHPDNEHFNEQLRDYVVENQPIYPIVYIYSSNLNKQIINQLKNELLSSHLQYLSDECFLQSNFYLFSDGKIKDVLHKEEKDIQIEDVKVYLDSLGDVAND